MSIPCHLMYVWSYVSLKKTVFYALDRQSSSLLNTWRGPVSFTQPSSPPSISWELVTLKFSSAGLQANTSHNEKDLHIVLIWLTLLCLSLLVTGQHLSLGGLGEAPPLSLARRGDAGEIVLLLSRYEYSRTQSFGVPCLRISYSVCLLSSHGCKYL